MKLVIIIMITCFVQVSAATFAQKLTYSKKGASMEEIFKEIKKQTGYNVLYSPEKVDDHKKIDVDFKETALPEVLDKVTANQSLEYSIDDKNISIRPSSRHAGEGRYPQNLVDRFNNIDVHGKILDSEGNGLPGASVKVKSTGKAVSTDANGNFFLRGVEEGAVLIVSFIGYLPKEVNASANMGDIVLEQSLSKLDEIQVIAYGTTTQRLSTGNVTTIKADVIEKQPVNNPLLALQGRVPGLFIEQATGFAGTGVKVRIQGTNSLNSGNDPLYVIDGIPYTSQLMAGDNSILGTSGGNGSSANPVGSPLSFINPGDIESIDVLKDADATAIYGSRAANGAILITTKKGKAGEIKVSANIQNGWGKVVRKLNLMNSQQYLEMRREAFKNDGLTSFGVVDYDLNGKWDNTRNTDWQKELIGRTAKYRDIQASISGGSDLLSFLASAGFHKEGNVFPGNFDDTKGSVHFNITSTSKNQKFKMLLSGSYLQDLNLLPGNDLTSTAMTLAPVAPSLFTPSGDINWQRDASGTATFYFNPISYLYQTFRNTTDNLVGNATLSYEVLPGLDIKSSFGYTTLQTNIIYTRPLVTPESIPSPESRNTTFGKNSVYSWSIEPQLNYNKIIGNSKIEALVGLTFQKERRDGSSILAYGFNSDGIMSDIKSATNLSVISSTNSIYKYNALFGRINYNWKDKYILNFTARRDGSSRFGSENQFHNFGAIGSAWIFTQEKMIQENLSFLSFGKLRASYGTTGNDQIPEYQFLSLYDATSGLLPYQGTTGYYPNRLTNPNLEWEETKKLQVGLDLGILKDRILLSANYSLNRSSNQLVPYILPLLTGFINVQANSPATVENTGLEFTVSTNNLNSKKVKWTSSFNITIPKNKLVSYSDYGSSTETSLYVIGESVNVQKKYQFLGVDPATGIYQVADRMGNPTTNPAPNGSPNSDAVVLINPDPKFYGGFQNTFTYKGFQLDFLFSFVKQIGPNYLFGTSLPAGYFKVGMNNEPASQLDRWVSPGDITNVQKYTTGLGLYTPRRNVQNSDISWTDASYIRLKNLSLSWQFPDAWKRVIRLKKCRLYLQGQNLLTITKYAGLDPESKSSVSLPPLRVVTMGIQVEL